MRAWSRQLQALRDRWTRRQIAAVIGRKRLLQLASNSDTKRLWRTLHTVLGEVSSGDVGKLAGEDFAVFFKDKVESVRVS